MTVKKRSVFTSRIIIAFFIMAVLSVGCFLWFFRVNSMDTTIFTVNGEKVTKEEFLAISSGLRGSVYSDFVLKYGEAEDGDFWTTNFDGQIPREVLKKQTLEKIKKIKIEQILFKKYGLVDDISYQSFQKELQSENKRRKTAVAKNEPIYGPIQYNEKAYYDYLQEDREEKLKKKLISSDLSSTEEEIGKYYDNHKDELFCKSEDMNVEKISVSYLDSYGNPSKDLKAKAEKLLESIINGDDFQKSDIASIEQSGLTVEYAEQIVNETSRMDTDIFNKVVSLQKGQFSDIYEEDNCIYIFRIVDIISNGYKAISEVRDQIVSFLADEKYNSLLEKLLSESKIVVNEKNYDAIEP